MKQIPILIRAFAPSRLRAFALACALPLASWAQQVVSGNVTDDSGLPLPGATVVVQNTNRGTTTDFDGNYQIQANPGETLVFSYVGYASQNITIGTNATINVQMQVSGLLEEVVITAYGTQTKESLTGSVAEIKSDELTKVASGNAIKGLAGKVAGVQIFSNSGQPGSAPIIRFRGIGSLNGSSAPLFVVDGVPFNESITSINPNDIESISFLKDAAAAALYGNRGANGVVIISTKKGKKSGKGSFKVNIDVKTSFTSRALKDYNVMTRVDEYLEAYHKMLKTSEILANNTSPEDAGEIASQNLFDGPTGLVYNPYGGDRSSVVDPITGKSRGGELLWTSDWRDVLFNDDSGVQSSYISVNGGTRKSTYFFSLSHEENEGYNINTGFDRYTLRLNIDSEISDNLNLGISSNYSNREIRGTLTNNITGNFAWVRNIAPIYPVFAVDHATGEIVRDENGRALWDWADVESPNATDGRPFNGFSNPHALQTLNVNRQIRDNLTTRAFGSVDLFNGFNFTYTFGVDLQFFNDTDYTNNFVGSATGDINGRLVKVSQRRQTFTNQQLLSWKKTFSEKHNLEALAGHETSQFESDRLRADKRNQLISTDISPDLFAENDGAPSVFGGPEEYNLEGFFLRVLYEYSNKYYANISFRRDGSSVFHPDNRWGNFYGGGVAWRVSQESFMDNVDWVSELKLKLSIGQQGNDIVFYPDTVDRDGFLIRNYAPYLNQWGVNSDGEAFELGLEFLGNEDLKWETSTNFNIGFELALFNNRLKLESEFFTREISDLISNRPLPNSSGLPSVPENVMDMRNTGVEAVLTYNIISGNDLTWTASLNATHYENEITGLAPGKDFIEPDGTLFSSRYRWEIGRSAYDFYMRKFTSVNPENGNARWFTSKEFEANGTTPIVNNETEDYSHAEEVFLNKSSLPDINGGFSTSVVYKNFDLSIDLSYQFGGHAYDAIYDDGLRGQRGSNFHRDFSKTWTFDNTDAKLPRVFDGSNNYSFSDLFIEKSDFISLNDIALGYTIPSSTTQKIGVEKVRIYALGNNLALWTESNRQGFDPRQRIAGNNNSVRYPTIRTFSLGLNINF